MFGQKCANCGYEMDFFESATSNILKFVKGNITQNAIGMNTISNANELKCPKCGEKGRWIRDDED